MDSCTLGNGSYHFRCEDDVGILSGGDLSRVTSDGIMQALWNLCGNIRDEPLLHFRTIAFLPFSDSTEGSPSSLDLLIHFRNRALFRIPFQAIG